ncbi:FecR family protein [Chitinophaga sp. RAB17]|uniref:FecR family protein n=1 Tax=Chitinophaga sp. RAB17 TaxID=3233049 RepID=UPI003F8E8345
MKSDVQKLKELLASDQRSDEEEQWLLNYLETTDAAELRALVAAQYEKDLSTGVSITDTTSRQLWDQIRMRLDENPHARVVRMKNRGRVLKWAAAIMLLVAGSFYLWYPRTRSSMAAVTITPGSSKAMLTLADGKIVTLNDTGTQVIRQGTTNIRQDNGQLQYATTGNEGAAGYNLLTTPRGGEFRVTLPDGSNVWLNAASSLKYPTSFNGKRMVELKGQAYFEVAKNARQPFMVKVNEMEVQVLGTSFDIMAYPDEAAVNTTLLTGAVVVKHQHTEKKLQPGQQTVLNTTSGTMTVQPADIEKVMGWKNGLFDLEDTDLPTLLRQLSRWYDINIVDQSGGHATQRFGGRVGRDMSLTDVVKILEQYDVHCRIEGRTLTVLSEK